MKAARVLIDLVGVACASLLFLLSFMEIYLGRGQSALAFICLLGILAIIILFLIRRVIGSDRLAIWFAAFQLLSLVFYFIYILPGEMRARNSAISYVAEHAKSVSATTIMVALFLLICCGLEVFFFFQRKSGDRRTESGEEKEGERSV